jgi:hypothetical protein
MYQVFEVSRSTYYDWLNRKPSRLSRENEVLKAELVDLHRQRKGGLGSPKLTLKLKYGGFQVTRLMKQPGIKSISYKNSE